MKKSIPLNNYYYRYFFPVLILFVVSVRSYAQAPANDLCANATLLTQGATCTTTNGTLLNATATAGVPGGCGAATGADVWYKFVATSIYPEIQISSIASSLSGGTATLQLLSGACGALVSLECVTTTNTSTVLAPLFPGLTIGTTYFIRVSTLSTGPFTGVNWGFRICVSNLPPAVVDYGKSYVNISKGTVGGTVQPKDTLEIRATCVVKGNIAINTSFTDNIPVNTTYIPGTLRVLTNEGKIYKQYTDIAADDGGTIAGSAVTINFGVGATAALGGNVASVYKPSFYKGTCIIVASFRVQVNAAVAYGTKISVGGGTFKYYTPANTAVPIVFPLDTIMVYNNFGICANTVGTNAIISESGGTFGSGNAKNRAPSSKVPINYTDTVFTPNTPQDYYYGVSNNTSTNGAGYTTVNTWGIPDGSATSHRVFTVWDIIGDHTGAISPTLGNPPTDTTGGKKGGYMVVINAAYRTDTAFLDTISNLCPSTYYQYTAWFRNICSRCGCDSNGNGAGVSVPAYVPTAAADSSGVYPNMTFNINGYDYFSTGNMLHTGQWVQKGFTYLTGSNQTSMIISIRNNAPGGGGNDWAIDDIGVASCSPVMSLTPNKPDTLCYLSDDTVRFRVSSFFNNYTQWKLEQSVDGGLTWGSPGLDTLGKPAQDSSLPVFNPVTGQYEYIVSRYYRLNMLDSMIIYRLIVASNTLNLTNANCSFVTSSPKVVRMVDCMKILPTTIISFNGQVKDDLANLTWISDNETGNVKYTIERSADGVSFAPVGVVNGSAAVGSGATYNFIDPTPLTGSAYYRINMGVDMYHKYSKVVLLSSSYINLAVKSLINPFTDYISFDLVAPGDDVAGFVLTDSYGRLIKKENQQVSKGLNSIRIYNLSALQSGVYTLQIQYGDKLISKQVVKMNK